MTLTMAGEERRQGQYLFDRHPPQTPTPTVWPLVGAVEAVVEPVAQFAHVNAELCAQAVVLVGLASGHLALRTCKTAKGRTVTKGRA